MVKKTADKCYGGMAACSELSENKPRQNYRLGDITWVKQSGTSWWPAQVVDEASVSSKPKKTTKFDALVRLYGTCQYLYVDPWKSSMEFEMILKEENKTAMEAFHEVLQKELSNITSPNDEEEEPPSDDEESASDDEEASSDDEEEAVNTKAKKSAKKGRQDFKRSGHGVVKGSATTKVPGDKREDKSRAKQDQEFWSNAKARADVQEGRKQKVASRLDKGRAVEKVSSEDSAEDLRNRAHKQACTARDKKGRKTAPAAREEGSRRSGRANVTHYLDTSEDSTLELHDANAAGNKTVAGDITSVNRSWRKNGSSTVDEAHQEIKAMVRDLLLGDIIARQHAAEMAYVDEVIFGICDAIPGTSAADTKGGGGIKRAAGVLEADDSGNVAKKPRKGEVTNLENGDCQNAKRSSSKGSDINSCRGAGAAVEGSEQRSTRAKSRLRGA